MKFRQVRTLILVLLAVLLPTARVSADQKVTVVTTGRGTVIPDRTMAREGQTVRLFVTPARGYMLKAGSLLVEQKGRTDDADRPAITRSEAPRVGLYVALSQQNDSTYTFVMPSTDVEIRSAFAARLTTTVDVVETGDTLQHVDDVVVVATVDEENGRSVTLETITIGETDTDDKTVILPSEVVASDGSVYQVSGIAAGAFLGQTDVTDILLPDTEEPLDIAEGAFQLSDSGDEMANIHAPLALLADYALMTSLDDHYEAGRVMAEARPPHRYWTFSCGVDVRLPESVSAYSCQLSPVGGVEIVRIASQVVKANNGVLVDDEIDSATSHRLVAVPSTDRPSGMPVATGNARSYAGNLLEPVIRKTHYDAGGYYIMSHNEFHTILQEGAEIRLPASKAVLHLPGNATRTRSLTIKRKD